MTNFERIGGETALEAIISDFVDRLFVDPMIGFFFRDVSSERIKKFEYQHAAAWLGADVVYQGRTLDQAHHTHPILIGHFNRRRTILANVLKSHGVPADIAEAWLAHTDSLRSQVMKQES